MTDLSHITEEQWEEILDTTEWDEQTFSCCVDESLKGEWGGMSDSTLEPMTPQTESVVEKVKKMTPEESL